MRDALAEILADPRVATIAALRADNAARARKAQADHRRYTIGFVIATGLAAISGALVLYGAGGEPEASPTDISQTLFAWLSARPLRSALFALQATSLGLAAFAGYKLRSVGGEGDWFKERRAAELGRADLYDAIMKIGAKKGPAFERAAFAGFLDKQLDGQIRYYAGAEARHGVQATRTATIGASIAALVAAGGATAGISGAGSDVWVALAAGIGVVAPILVNAVRSWQEATFDREKAERYRTAKELLMRLKAESAEAAQALAQGDSAPARNLVAQVHSVMREENGAWMPAKALT
jgi:hypothetical protein